MAKRLPIIATETKAQQLARMLAPTLTLPGSDPDAIPNDHYAEPVIVELADIPDGDSDRVAANQVKLTNGDWGTVKGVNTRILSAERVAAMPIGSHGLCALSSPRYFAVLIEELLEAPHVYATGTISASSDQLTTSEDLSAFVDDYNVLICGAGPDGGTLVTTIASATASIATLEDDATTAVTSADIGILSVSTVWILERTECGRLVRKRIDGELVVVPVVNDFRDIPIDAGTLIGIEFQEGYWVPYKMDCDAVTWDWLEISS